VRDRLDLQIAEGDNAGHRAVQEVVREAEFDRAGPAGRLTLRDAALAGRRPASTGNSV
jgi:hypothetical protein